MALKLDFNSILFPSAIWTDPNCKDLTLGEWRLLGYLSMHAVVGERTLLSKDELLIGRRKRNGERVDRGTGLSVMTLANARKGLVARGWLRESQEMVGKRMVTYFSLNVRTPHLSPPIPTRPILTARSPEGTESTVDSENNSSERASGESSIPTRPILTARSDLRNGAPAPKGGRTALEVDFSGSRVKNKSKTRRDDKSSRHFPEALDTEEFRHAWAEWTADRKERRKPLTDRAADLALHKLAKWGSERAVAAIEYSIANGYQGIFEDSSGSKLYQKPAANVQPVMSSPSPQAEFEETESMRETREAAHRARGQRIAADNPWRSILEMLLPLVNGGTFNSWFRPTHLYSMTADTLFIEVPNPVFIEFLTTKFMGLIEESMRRLKIDYEIRFLMEKP